ncbi:MAG: carboxymuconolactone decarboxylase family protein [Caldilineaceae bacterium]|nr:carboxymuconolactone decarboxylase family protein [Caldilineaceae bacterium]
MSRFPILAYDEVSDPAVHAVYDEIKAELGFGIVPNLFKSMALRPSFLETQWSHFRATVLQGSLPRTLKEMIGVAISQTNGSEYALRVHLHSLSALGISEEVLHLLVTDIEQCPLPERQKQAILFGLRVATQPKQVSDQEYHRLYALGLSEAEIFELIATANLFLGVNQYTDAIMLEIDQL